jgi:hypothetical protein
MEREYLNEKSYSKTRKGLILVGILIILIGTTFGGYNIYKANQQSKVAESIVTPKPGAEGWFDSAVNKQQLKFESSKNIAMMGITPIVFSLIIGGMCIFWANQRKILAYGTQAIIPVVKEGIEEMAPTVGKAMGTVVKEAAPGYAEAIGTLTPNIGKAVGTIARETVPVYGEVVKEVFKGIKDDMTGEVIYCKHCGASIDKDSKFCSKCGKEQ